MTKFIHIVGSILLGLLIFGATVPMQGCATTPVDQMTQEQFDGLDKWVGLLGRATASRLIREEVVSREELCQISVVVLDIVEDPVNTAGSLVSGPLVEAGFTEEELLIVLTLMEDVIRTRFDFGTIFDENGNEFLSERSQQILTTAANAICWEAIGEVLVAVDPDRPWLTDATIEMPSRCELPPMRDV